MEISALAGGLAHEIRNPLSTLKVNLQLLGEDWDDPSVSERDLRRRSRRRLDVLQGEATRLNEILDKFLRLIGRHELSLAPHDLNEIVRAFVAFFEPRTREAGIRIDMCLAEGPLRCRVDGDLCTQMLLNLGLNALEAMTAGGTLTVRTFAADVATACVEVADTGPGLAADSIERVFEPFHSGKPQGSGLGLAITRKIARAHGGEVVARNGDAGGAVFTITLPRTSDAAA